MVISDATAEAVAEVDHRKAELPTQALARVHLEPLDVTAPAASRQFPTAFVCPTL